MLCYEKKPAELGFVGFLILQLYHCGDILELRQNGGDEDGQNNYVVSRFGEYRRGSGFW